MPDFSRTHAALFDELERQGIYWADLAKLAQAVIDAQAIITRQQGGKVRPYSAAKRVSDPRDGPP